MKTEKVATENDARIKVAKANANALYVYCPMLRAVCHKDCLCLSKARYVTMLSADDSAPVYFKFYPRECTNPSLIRG